MAKVKYIFISILVNVIFISWILKEYNLEHNPIDFIDSIAFGLSFGYGVPIVLSPLLALAILFTPGIGVYFFLKIYEAKFNK